jgi:serine/threonine protein kinase
MGKVYLAQDTSLERKVALKFLPEVLQQDAIAPQRFLREAKAAAALDHPFICHIHEIGEEEGRAFIAMEYVEGETLEARLKKERLSYREVLRIGSEIAEALQRAHQHGIVHRDLKPSNIMLTPEGRVKVMDFGLAKKIISEDGTEQDITADLTKEGATLGTLAYMSPEQLRGDKVDARSDLFSFGVLLFEMLVGKHPFRRSKPMETSAAILAEAPAFPTGSQAGPGIALHETIQKLLAKVPVQRCQTVEEVRETLKRLADQAIPTFWTRKRIILATAAALVIFCVFVPPLFRTAPVPPKVGIPKQLTSDLNYKGRLWLASDGHSIYYSQVDTERVALQAVVHEIAVEGSAPVPVNPWPEEKDRRTIIMDVSPQSGELLVGSDMPARKGGRSALDLLFAGIPLWILAPPAWTARRVEEIQATSALWSPTGDRIAYSSDADLYVSPSDGSDPIKIFSVKNREPNEVLWVWAWSPNGQRICYGNWVWGQNRGKLWEIGAAGGKPLEILPDWKGQRETWGQWTPDGSWFLFRADLEGTTALWGLCLETSVWEKRSSQPVKLANLESNSLLLSPDGKSLFGIRVQDRGELMSYDESKGSWNFYRFPPETSAGCLDFSSDSQWVVYAKYPEGTLWRSRVDGSQKLQLEVADGKKGRFPRWSPDGTRIAFVAANDIVGLHPRVYVSSRDGGTPQRVLSQEYWQSSASWTRDGRLLVSGDGGPRSPLFRLVDLETGQVEDVPGTERLRDPVWSPDGRYLAACCPGPALALFSTETETWTAYDEAQPLQVLSWTPDSQFLYFSGPQNHLDRVRIPPTGTKLVVEEVADLTDIGAAQGAFFDYVGPRWHGFDPDGKLLVMRPPGPGQIYSMDFEVW